MRSRRMWTSVVALSILAGGRLLAQTNLAINGGFEDPTNAFAHWKVKYDEPGKSWYYSNHERVTIAADGSRKHVMALWGDDGILQAPGQGTIADSYPIPVEPGAKYEVTVWARSTGPQSRVLIEGYQWAPGIKPHPDPEYFEMRKVYKFSQLYFSDRKEGTMSSVDKSWRKATVVVPDPEMSSSADAQKALKKIKFFMLHICAIGGSTGTLYIDDVSIKKVGMLPPPAPKPATPSKTTTK